MDDGYIIGPGDVIFPALVTFERRLREECGLLLQREKTEVLSWDGILPGGAPAGMVLAGLEVEGDHLPGFLCYGVPVGSDRYVEAMLEEKVDKIAEAAEKAVKVLAGERQALWAVIKWSVSQQFEYWLQHCYPTDVQAAAYSLKLWRVTESFIGSLIPEGEDSGCIVEVPGASVNGLSFQKMVVRLPIKLGGMGLRNLEFLRFAAFIGSVISEQAQACVRLWVRVLEVIQAMGEPCQLAQGGGP